MKFFQVAEYPSQSTADLPLLENNYEEFVATLCIESETTDNLTSFCNQLIHAKIELQALRKDKQIKLLNKHIPIKKFYYKAQRQIDEQLKMVKLRMRYSYKTKTEQETPNKVKTKLKWTGTASELVELGYAFYATKSFNNGELDIKELMQFLFSAFRFDVKNYYHTYTTIRKRNGDRTTFLDKLKRYLLQKMEDADNRKLKRG